MNLKERYRIERIQYSTAMYFVVKYHYLHRKAPCEMAFGLIENSTSQICGVIVYGTPSSATLRRGICGDTESDNVIELTRLWVMDGTPKNTESYFIGNTIKLVDKEIVVSFAEIEAGHVGTIYQATNWVYTGLSAKRTDWTIDGVELHGQTIADKYTAKEVREKFGDKFSLKDRPLKHRYIYFNCNKNRKNILLSKLRYSIKPYPKIECKKIHDIPTQQISKVFASPRLF
jgi:hypothetical protein